MRRFAAGSVLAIIALMLALLAGSRLGRTLSIRMAEREFPPPGRLIELDGRRSHIHCVGTGSPTVVLESGLDTRGSTSWEGVQSELGTISRVCAYDRAGMVWSEPGEEPRDAERIADELHLLLRAASELPPYVVVGHSLGGLFSLVYDQRHPEEVAGFVFVDASHPEQDSRWPAEMRQQASSQSGPPRWLFRVFAPYRIFVDADRDPESAYWWRSFPEGVLAEAAAVEQSSRQAGRTRSLGDRPIVVLTAGELWPMPGMSPEGVAATRQTWMELQAELAGLSTNSDHRVVRGADHYIHEKSPEAVITAVRDVVAAVRQSSAVPAR